MTTTLQELDEVLSERPISSGSMTDYLLQSKYFEAVSGRFVDRNAPKIRAALELLAKLEQGYVLVPREPTDEMLDAALRLHPSFSRLAMTVMIEDAINTAPSAGGQDAS